MNMNEKLLNDWGLLNLQKEYLQFLILRRNILRKENLQFNGLLDHFLKFYSAIQPIHWNALCVNIADWKSTLQV